MEVFTEKYTEDEARFANGISEDLFLRLFSVFFSPCLRGELG
jgi:hypothetical protein